MVAFLFLHFFGLGGVIVFSLIQQMFDLALINGLVFLMLLRLEMVLCTKHYTVPMPVWADGTVWEKAAMGEMSSMEQAPMVSRKMALPLHFVLFTVILQFSSVMEFIEEAAEFIGCDVETLKETVEKNNSYVKMGKDDEF